MSSIHVCLDALCMSLQHLFLTIRRPTPAHHACVLGGRARARKSRRTHRRLRQESLSKQSRNSVAVVRQPRLTGNESYNLINWDIPRRRRTQYEASHLQFLGP